MTHGDRLELDAEIAEQHIASVASLALTRQRPTQKRSGCPLPGCVGHRTHNAVLGGGIVSCPNIPEESAFLVQMAALDPDAPFLCPLLRDAVKEAHEQNS